MSTVAKFLVGLALILPMTGYVVGSLVSTSAGEPDRRDPVIVNDVRQVPPPGESSPPRPGRDQGAPGSSPGEKGDDAGGEDDDDRDVDQNGMTVVKPEPTRPDDRDDDGDDDRDRDGGDDDRDDRTDTDDGGDD